MLRPIEMNGKNSIGSVSCLVLAAVAALGLTAPNAMHAQAPGVVFSNPQYLRAASSTGTVQDFSATAGRVAANQRGDVFWINTNFNGAPNNMVMVPAGTNEETVVISNLGANTSNAVTTDIKGNLWALNSNYGIVFIPVVAGVYPSDLDATKITSTCTLPVASNIAPCNVPLANNATIGSPALSDILVDASGNLYGADLADNETGYNKRLRILQYDAATLTPVVILDNLPAANQSGRIAISANGDLFEADGTSVSYSVAGSGVATVLGGFSKPTGIASDFGGNIYVTESGSFDGAGSITVLPNVGGKVTPAERFTIVYGDGNTGAPYYSAGIDGFGTITWPGGGYGGDFYRSSLASLSFGPEAVGSFGSSLGLPMYFDKAATFGSFKVVSSSGTAVPFAVTTTTCTAGQAYAAAASCNVSLNYVATAVGPQAGTLFAYDTSGKLLGTVYLGGFGLAPILNVDPGAASSIGSGWNDPGAISVDAVGSTYVADTVTGAIYKNGSATAIATGFNKPSSVVVDADGNLYVADSGNGRILEVPLTDNAYGAPITIFTGTSGRVGLAIDVLSNLYVADSGNGRALILGSAANLPVGSNPSPLGSGFVTPVAIAVDGAGNIYISDSGTGKISQYNFARATLVPIVTGLTSAAGVAVDAGGNLYYADAGKQTITRVPNVSGTLDASASSTLATIVATPSSIAVDVAGNVYATDPTDATVGSLNRTSATISFGPVVEPQPSQSISATLSNGGSASLTLGTPYYTASGANTADFSVQSSSTCTSGAALDLGASCSLVSVFTPSVIGPESETLSLASDGGNASLSLTGTGTGTITATITGATTLVYGNTTTYAVTVTEDGTYAVNISGSASSTTSVVVAGGTGSFKIPVLGAGSYTIGLAGTIGTASLTVTPASLYATAKSATRAYGTVNPSFESTITGAVNGDSFVGGGTTTATISSNAGSYPIIPNAVGSASANYTIVATNGVLSITQVKSSAVLSVVSSGSGTTGTPVTFRATVASSTTGVPSGTVTFEDVSVTNDVIPIGTATLGADQNPPGVATFTTSSLASGTIYVVAVYNGDVNFITSTTSAQGVTVSLPTFTLSASQQTLQIVQGQSASLTLTVTPVGNFISPVSFSCQGMPLEASCAFSNPSITPSGGPVSTMLTIKTTAPATADIKAAGPWQGMGGGTVLALAGGIFIGWRRKRFTKGLLLFALVVIASLIPLTGCGVTEKSLDTPLGISTITITGSSSANTTQVTAQVRLAVTSK